jgi:heme-degrading monooxygenase HmoA
MIARSWRGTVRRADAEEYADYIRETGFAEYGQAAGNQGAWMLRRDDGERTEFITLSLWDSENAIRAFAGDDIEAAVLYPEDKRYLIGGQVDGHALSGGRPGVCRQHAALLSLSGAGSRYPVNRPGRARTIARRDWRFSSDLGKRASRSTPSPRRGEEEEPERADLAAAALREQDAPCARAHAGNAVGRGLQLGSSSGSHRRLSSGTRRGRGQPRPRDTVRMKL